MTDFSTLQSVLLKHFEGKITDVHVERGNELHCDRSWRCTAVG
jgi:hypothetical protein